MSKKKKVPYNKKSPCQAHVSGSQTTQLNSAKEDLGHQPQRSLAHCHLNILKPEVRLYFFIPLCLTFLFGILLYDVFSTVIGILISVGSTAGAALLFFLSLMGIRDFGIFEIKNELQRKRIIAGTAGFILATLIVYFVCGLMGLRFGVTISFPSPISTNSAAVETISEFVSPQPAEISDKAPSTDSTHSKIDGSPKSPPVSNSQYTSTDPIMITPNPKIPDVNNICLKDDLILLLGIDSNVGQTNFSYGEKQLWRSVLSDSLKRMACTVPQPDSDVVNSNKSFVQYVQAATEISSDIDENGQSEEKIKNAIEKREAAYRLHATRDLCELLSNDYDSLARLFANAGLWNSAYENYLSAIRYRLSHIKGLAETDDHFYYDVYALAIVYQAIGDFKGLSTAQKIEASYISACLFEVVSQNIFDGYYYNCQFLSCYFSGMENHKLLLLTAANSYRASVEYFQDAYGYYKKSLDGTLIGSLDGAKYIKKNNEYLSQLCRWAQDYISTYGQPPELLTKAEYRELEKKYHENSR